MMGFETLSLNLNFIVSKKHVRSLNGFPFQPLAERMVWFKCDFPRNVWCWVFFLDLFVHSALRVPVLVLLWNFCSSFQTSLFPTRYLSMQIPKRWSFEVLLKARGVSMAPDFHGVMIPSCLNPILRLVRCLSINTLPTR